MSVSEFFHMGGYALYVWSSYGLALVLLVAVFIQPLLERKTLCRELKTRYRQQNLQQQARSTKAAAAE